MTENLFDGNLEMLRDVLGKAERGEIQIEHLDMRQGINEIPPENNCRKFETTGEQTIIFVVRELKNWNERN